MKATKGLRGNSMMAAVTWNTIFLMFVIKARQTLKTTVAEEFDLVDFFEVLFIGYNIIMHGPIFVVNAAIILKEINYEFLQLGNDVIGGDKDYSLGLIHVYMFIRNVLFILNPLNWFDVIYYIIYGHG